MESGDQSVIVAGITRMLLLCAYNWDFKEQVLHCPFVYYLFFRIITCTLADATALSNSYFGDGTGPYHLSGVSCSGEERTLLQCSYSNGIIGYHTCSPGNDAGVRCDGMCTHFGV